MDSADLLAELDPARGVLVNGSWVGPGKTFAVEDPATEEPFTSVADGGIDDALAAADAAARALPAWAATAPRSRAELLRRVFELLVADADRIADLISRENGKSRVDAWAEVHYSAEFFRWYSEEAARTEGSYGEAPLGGVRTIVTHRPVGVAALVTPWNFPLAMAARKIAPALAAGCTMVLKPAAETPLAALALARILMTAGVPDGVVNVVPTLDAPGVVGAWLNHPAVRMVSFTGSTGVGRSLLGQAAQRVLNAGLELGGNAPFIVTRDADLDAAVEGAMIAKFRNGGQACTAANRFLIHADVAEEFLARFGPAVEALSVGPADSGAQIGPMVSAHARAGIAAKVERAVEAGARISHRVASTPTTGWFYPPTVLVDLKPDSPILAEEIFGPVAPILTWRDESEMLRLANGTEYGLTAYVYSGRLQDALRIAEALDAGMVGVNRGAVSDPSAPFGGVKQSGLGREGAREGIREFQETQYFSASLD